MIKYILEQVRNTAITDPTLNGIIGTRFFPQNVDLEDNTNNYPFIVVSVVGGFPDLDNYDADTVLLEALYVSDSNIDQAIDLYDRFRAIINRQSFSNTVDDQYFKIVEDSTPFDSSGLYGDRFLYVYTNTYRVRTIGI